MFGSVGRRGRECKLRQLKVAASALTVLVVVAAGCGTSTASGGASTSTSRSPALTAAQIEAGAGHACVVGGSGTPHVTWPQVANPIISYSNAGAKDEAVIWAGGRWHMLFSYMTHSASDPGGVRWNIATATSTDMVHWSAPDPWPAQIGVVGVASPDIVREPSGEYVVTYQSNAGPTTSTQDKLFYRTSSDLVHWSTPKTLARNLAPGPADRQIDPALAFTGHGLILGFKASVGSSTAQEFEIAASYSGSLTGPWVLLGQPNVSVYQNTVENYEFVHAAGHWQLIATTNLLDQPWIFQLTGNPTTPTAWLKWGRGRQLIVPSQAWNSGPGISSVGFEHANSAFLCNARATDGYYYLLYAGSTELTQFGGWGHARIGIARSRDLVHWEAAPGRSG
ncbi:MAG: glycoside hydrolase family protein [Acidimicrobiales bacterium]